MKQFKLNLNQLARLITDRFGEDVIINNAYNSITIELAVYKTCTSEWGDHWYGERVDIQILEKLLDRVFCTKQYVNYSGYEGYGKRLMVVSPCLGYEK